MKKEIFGVKQEDLILFGAFGGGYVLLQLFWTLVVARDPGGVLPFLANANPVAVNNNTLLFFVVACSVGYAVLGWMRNRDTEKPVIDFLIRSGLALQIYSCAGQIAAVFVPGANWASPGQGIPVMRTLTIVVPVGMLLAGIAANMIWVGEKREEFLAATSKKKR